MTDFVERGLYAAFKLCPESAVNLLVWAGYNGIVNTCEPDYLHITTVYSKVDLPYEPMGKLPERLEVKVLGFDVFGSRTSNPKGYEYFVIKVEHPLLNERWRIGRDLGMKWDYPDYGPHITISEKNRFNLTPETVLTPITFPIYISEEYSQRLRDYSAKVD